MICLRHSKVAVGAFGGPGEHIQDSTPGCWRWKHSFLPILCFSVFMVVDCKIRNFLIQDGVIFDTASGSQ